ncbi:MAG: serine/threonine-protein kinase, partial [Vicinamibacterales bacterium]
MSTWLPNNTLAHLRDVAEWPDLGERYEVKRRLGRGGMGVVYGAYDRVLDREVAIKVLDDLDANGQAARRLQEEARILARLEHPGIVPVHDAGMLADGRAFYVMMFVRGERLDETLDLQVSLAERLELFLRICDAVSFAHAQGIVHRDLKPSNVMRGSYGEVLV